jgi:hypothetical protein
MCSCFLHIYFYHFYGAKIQIINENDVRSRKKLNLRSIQVKGCRALTISDIKY